MAYTSLGNGFNITGANYIDERIVLTKEQMLTAEDDFFLPDLYFAFCPDDSSWYTYNIDNEEDPETGKYRLMPAGLVNDVLVNGVSVVEDKVAKVVAVDDVKVDGSSVVEDGIANIDLSEKQDKLTAGDKIKIDNNVISVEGIENPEAGYGILVGDDGTISIDTDVVPEKAEMPTKVSDLQNDLGFIDKAVLDLENYYLKDETYSQQEVNDLISSISGGVTLEVVAVLPLTGEANKIYLVRRAIDSQIYDQYVWFNNAWMQVGSTEINLDDYYTKQEIAQLLVQKQDNLTAGAGIALNNSFISVDMGDTLTTTGNKLDVKTATPNQKGVVAYDDSTIKMNGQGQLYATGGGGGGGTEYVAGPNIQISGNVISATDTTYRAGDAIAIGSNNDINVLYDDQTIHKNRRGELYMDAVPIDAGEGIRIVDGTIEIVPSEVADAIDLDNYQEKLIAGDNIQINGRIISATGGGSGSGANWGEIGGTLNNQTDLYNQLLSLQGSINAKQNQLVAGDNITLTNVGGQTRIDAQTGGSGGASSFSELSGSPYDNANLKNALDSKQPTIDSSHKIPASNVSGLSGVATSGSYNDLSNKPSIGNGTISIYQGSTLKGTFTLNQLTSKSITLDPGGGSTPNNGQLTIQRNGTQVGVFTANQSTNSTVDVKVPTFSYDTSTGVLTITDN